MFAELIARHPWLWALAWQSTLCLAAGLGASRLLRRQAVRAHQVLLLGLFAAAIIPAISQIVKQNQWGLFVAERAVPLLTETAFPSQQEIPARSTAVAAHTATTPRPIAYTAAKSIPPAKRFDWPRAAMLLWLVASTALLLRLAAQFLLAWRAVRRSQGITVSVLAEMIAAAKDKLAIDADVAVRCNNRVHSPVIWCWGRRPILLLPAGTCGTEDGLDWPSILCHELAHWKRQDHIHGLLAELAVCAMPWQPLAWWVRRRLEALSEEACDDWVIASGQAATRYAKTLLDLLPQKHAALVPGVVASRSGLSARIRRILHNTCGNPRPGLQWTLAASLFCGGFSLGVAFAQTRPASTVPTPPAARPQTSAPAPVEPLDKNDRILLRLVDTDGRPVSGAMAARSLTEDETPPFGDRAAKRRTLWMPPAQESDSEGRIALEATPFFGTTRDENIVYILHTQQGIGTIQEVRREDVNKTVTVALKPLCRVHGAVDSARLAAMGMPLKMASVILRPSQAPTQHLVRHSSHTAPHDFDVLLPPGEYTLTFHGWGAKGRDSRSVNASAESKDLTITVPDGQSTLDLGVIDLRPEKMAETFGKPAPEIGPMREWHNGSPVTLAELRGQTIWLHFGGNGSCSGKPTQNLIDLHNDYADQGVTIIAIYNCGSMAELEKGWATGNGPVDMRKVPFRIALDGGDPAGTYARYGITAFPINLLIDPAGSIVGRANGFRVREFLAGMPWIHEPTAVPAWRERFDEVYRLADGEILKRIPRPFISERGEYYRREERFAMEPMQIIFLWEGQLQPDPLSLHSNGLLQDILDSILRHRYDAPQSLLNISLPGDWIIRRDASTEVKLQALEEHIQRELGRKIRIEMRSVEREVLHVSGVFNFHPLVGTGQDAVVQLYVTEMNPAPVAEDTADGALDFASVVGQAIGMPISYDRIEPTGPLPIRYWREDFIRTGGMQNEQERAKRLATLLDNLAKQTELKFEVRKISMPRWVVTEEGGRKLARRPR